MGVLLLDLPFGFIIIHVILSETVQFISMEANAIYPPNNSPLNPSKLQWLLLFSRLDSLFNLSYTHTHTQMHTQTSLVEPSQLDV